VSLLRCCPNLLFLFPPPFLLQIQRLGFFVLAVGVFRFALGSPLPNQHSRFSSSELLVTRGTGSDFLGDNVLFSFSTWREGAFPPFCGVGTSVLPLTHGAYVLLLSSSAFRAFFPRQPLLEIFLKGFRGCLLSIYAIADFFLAHARSSAPAVLFIVG